MAILCVESTFPPLEELFLSFFGFDPSVLDPVCSESRVPRFGRTRWGGSLKGARVVLTAGELSSEYAASICLARRDEEIEWGL
jgi:hypothetical protein